MFWLALLTRDTGTPASERLQIKDEVVALDFDLAVSYRLFLLRIEEQKAMAKRIAREVSKIFAGPDDSDDVIVAADLATDRFADKNTEIW